MKNKFRSIIFATIFIVIGVFIGGCTTNTVSAEQTYPLKIWKQNQNDWIGTWNVVGENTGVNYIVVDVCSNGIAITPRLNADGSLYTSK